MSSPDSPSIPITFSCGYSGNSVEIFKGDVYADAHIGGSVTNPADQYFAANWHFYLPNSPYVKDIPTPDVTGTPTSDVPANTNQHYQLHDQQVPICNTGNCPNYILTPLP